MVYTVHVAVFIQHRDILRAKLNFSIYLQNNENLTKGKISHNILIHYVLETPFFSLSIPTLQLFIYCVNINTFKQNKIVINNTSVLRQGKYL